MTTIGISIAQSTSGEFIYFLYPSQVTLGNSATFDTIFENTGNTNITAQIQIHVKDSSLNTVASFYDDNYTLRIRDTRSFSATWTPTATGTYWVIANASYNSSTESNTTEQNASFTVVSTEVVPVIEIPGGGGGGGEAPLGITYNQTLGHIGSINLALGESYIIPVYVTNYGNRELHNLSLSVVLEKIEWDITPKSVSVLPINSTAMFYISVYVPLDALIKNYTLDFTLESNEVTNTGQIIIIVYPIELCTEVERAIKNYKSIINQANAEIEKAIFEKRNVSSALPYLLKAKEELELAKKYYELNDCIVAKEHLELVRENLKEVASELAKSIKSRIKIMIISTWWIVGVVLIILILIIFIVALIAKRKRKVVTKPLITILKEKREELKKSLNNLKKSYVRKQINERTYNQKRIEIEKEIGRVEEQILMQFGSERQKTVFEDLKKAYTEGIISKEIYNSTREKLINTIISKQNTKG